MPVSLRVNMPSKEALQAFAIWCKSLSVRLSRFNFMVTFCRVVFGSILSAKSEIVIFLAARLDY